MCPTPTNSDMRSGGQRSRAELLTLPCATQHQVAPEEARAASGARSHGSKDQGPGEDVPVFNEPHIADALGLEGGGEEFAQRSVSAHDPRSARSGWCPARRRAQHRGWWRTVAPVGRDDRVRLVPPCGPGRGLWEMRAQSLTDARPLSVAKHVNKIPDRRHQFQGAVRHHGLDGATPMT